MSETTTFPNVTWPESGPPQRLFRFSPLTLHECIHHGMEAERDFVMGPRLFYHDEWDSEDFPWAIIAWPEAQADELRDLLISLIENVTEFRLIEVHDGTPHYHRIPHVHEGGSALRQALIKQIEGRAR